ncbi:MAG: hypothetical protein ACRDZ1_09505 [Acidimicrobiia bacterium]
MSDPVLEAGAARLVYSPARGGRLISLTVDGLDLLVTPEVDDHDFGSFPMAPWAGRVRHGRFAFDGHDYELPCNNPQYAICVEPQTHPPDALNLGPSVVTAGHPLTASCSWRWDLAGWTE